MWSVDTGCVDCVVMWSVDTGCVDCVVMWSVDTGCVDCVVVWSVDTGCVDCVVMWSVDTSCVDCVTVWSADTGGNIVTLCRMFLRPYGAFYTHSVCEVSCIIGWCDGTERTLTPTVKWVAILFILLG
jgi:hypothetical protein